MTVGKLWAIPMLLFVSMAPALGQPNPGGSKGWFHSRHSGPAASHYRGNHIVAKHDAAKHTKPHHERHFHQTDARILYR